MTDHTSRTVAVVGTGGTISSVGKNSLDLTAYVDNKTIYQVDELLNAFPEAFEQANVIPVRFRALGSPTITPADWLDLAAGIEALPKEHGDIHGVVVTHGTACLEETAYFLNLALKVDFPVVLVGAQRPATGLSTDAGLNLVNAIRVAADPGSRGRGVLVLLNDEIHAARDVTKTSTLRLQTFKSHDFGLLGHADNDRIAYYRQGMRQTMPDTEFAVAGLADLPRVDILLSYAGADRSAIDAHVAAGAKGLVSAGMAPGFCTPGELEGFEDAIAQGVIVVQSTRAGTGRVVPVETFRPRGAVLADNLTPQKARVLLMLALTKSSDPAEIQEMFFRY